MSRDKSIEAWLASLSKEEIIDRCFLWHDAALETGRKYNAICAEKLALCKRINELCAKVEQLRKTARELVHGLNHCTTWSNEDGKDCWSCPLWHEKNCTAEDLERELGIEVPHA